MTDDENQKPGEVVNPEEFQTFDEFDPSLDPPERPGNDEATDEGDAVAFGRGVPSGTVMSAVGVLSAAYNRR